MKTAVNLITGFLGVGKTTAILDLLARRPPGETWAVLVNEFGEVGIDGAILGARGVAVREVAGGCLCCAAQLPLKVTLTRLIREVRPRRLLIEPSGLGHPAGVIDVLRDAWLAPHVELVNVITLVDPRQFLDPRLQALATYRDQLALADILVANRCDLAGPGEVEAFLAAARAMDPPRLHVAATERGRLDSAWLDLRGAAPPEPGHPPHDEAERFVSRGFTFPPEVVFDAAGVAAWFAAAGRHAAILRGKGLVRTGRDWQRFELVGGEVEIQPVLWRRDSRIGLVARRDAPPPWRELEAALRQAIRPASPG